MNHVQEINDGLKQPPRYFAQGVISVLYKELLLQWKLTPFGKAYNSGEAQKIEELKK